LGLVLGGIAIEKTYGGVNKGPASPSGSSLKTTIPRSKRVPGDGMTSTVTVSPGDTKAPSFGVVIIRGICCAPTATTRQIARNMVADVTTRHACPWTIPCGNLMAA